MTNPLVSVPTMIRGWPSIRKHTHQGLRAWTSGLVWCRDKTKAPHHSHRPARSVRVQPRGLQMVLTTLVSAPDKIIGGDRVQLIWPTFDTIDPHRPGPGCWPRMNTDIFHGWLASTYLWATVKWLLHPVDVAGAAGDGSSTFSCGAYSYMWKSSFCLFYNFGDSSSRSWSLSCLKHCNHLLSPILFWCTGHLPVRLCEDIGWSSITAC